MANKYFRPNALLHIEDDLDNAQAFCLIVDDPAILREYGGPLKHIRSKITGFDEFLVEEVEQEILRLEQESGDTPSIINIITAQVCREYLNRNIPSVIVSDSSFPLNGKKIVGWLKDHGYEDYPLIGLSATPIEDLESEIRDFFVAGNARYFEKMKVGLNQKVMDSLNQQIIFNRRWCIDKYAPKE